MQGLSPHLAAPPEGALARHSAGVANQLERYVIKDQEAMRPLAQLNAFMAQTYPRVDTVPIPVLAPVATGRHLAEFARTGEGGPQVAKASLSPVVAEMHFIAKTTRYDAILTVDPDWLRRAQVRQCRPGSGAHCRRRYGLPEKRGRQRRKPRNAR